LQKIKLPKPGEQKTAYDDGAVVPTLWRLEIANSLTVAMRRGRIDANLRRAALADLALLDITTDEDTDAHAWGETMNMADRFQLTLYDTAYLELAQRRPLRKLTGIPIVLNTSFNENEPVVCPPADCFLRTNMDLLVLGDVTISREESGRT
jgi:predicted nucleic acid-binding protein